MNKEIPIENIKIYLVRNQEGKWFHTKGIDGSDDSWQSDFKKARVYTKLGPARSCVTWWSNHYPKYGIPEIIEITPTTGVILDETNRVTKAVDKIKKEKIDSITRRHLQNIKQLEDKIKELNQLTKLN